MTDIKIDVDPEPEEKKDSARMGLLEMSRKMLLAAIGAAAVTKDELQGFVDRMVERGEIAEKDARGMMRDLIDRREKMEREKKEAAAAAHPAPATKADVDALAQKLAELSKQLEELKAQKAK